jgi:hypothetical protein
VNNDGDNDEMKHWLRGEHGGLHTNFWWGMLSQLGGTRFGGPGAPRFCAQTIDQHSF